VNAVLRYGSFFSLHCLTEPSAIFVSPSLLGTQTLRAAFVLSLTSMHHDPVFFLSWSPFPALGAHSISPIRTDWMRKLPHFPPFPPRSTGSLLLPGRTCPTFLFSRSPSRAVWTWLYVWLLFFFHPLTATCVHDRRIQEKKDNPLLPMLCSRVVVTATIAFLSSFLRRRWQRDVAQAPFLLSGPLPPPASQAFSRSLGPNPRSAIFHAQRPFPLLPLC